MPTVGARENCAIAWSVQRRNIAIDVIFVTQRVYSYQVCAFLCLDFCSDTAESLPSTFWFPTLRWTMVWGRSNTSTYSGEISKFHHCAILLLSCRRRYRRLFRRHGAPLQDSTLQRVKQRALGVFLEQRAHGRREFLRRRRRGVCRVEATTRAADCADDQTSARMHSVCATKATATAETVFLYTDAKGKMVVGRGEGCKFECSTMTRAQQSTSPWIAK